MFHTNCVRVIEIENCGVNERGTPFPAVGALIGFESLICSGVKAV
jgi:hypothetical protein